MRHSSKGGRSTRESFDDERFEHEPHWHARASRLYMSALENMKVKKRRPADAAPETRC